MWHAIIEVFHLKQVKYAYTVYYNIYCKHTHKDDKDHLILLKTHYGMTSDKRISSRLKTASTTYSYSTSHYTL